MDQGLLGEGGLSQEAPGDSSLPGNKISLSFLQEPSRMLEKTSHSLMGWRTHVFFVAS